MELCPHASTAGYDDAALMGHMRHARHAAVLALIAVVACTAAPTSLPAPPGVRVQVDTSFYDVEGTDRRAWLVSMRRAAANTGVRVPFLAQTLWTASWRYAGTHRDFSDCQAVGPTVLVEVHFTMPRLRSDSGVAPADAAEWRRHMRSLWTHEEGHARRAMRGAAEQLEVLRHLRVMDCNAFQQQARAATYAVMERYLRLDQDYDARTRHGARQGAFLIPDARATVSVDTTYRDTLP